MTEERLHKILARSGVASRRSVEAMLRAGRIKINGRIVTTPGVKIDPERDEVQVDGKPVYLKRLLEKRPVYLAFYKPAGVVTTIADPQGRPKITDFLHGVPERVFPVGRLDFDSEGLLFLTNDGELAHRLMHPRNKIPKTYAVWVVGKVGNESLKRLREGVVLDDGPTQPAAVRVIQRLRAQTLLEIIITEGRKRQVRRMCDAIGHPVIKLERTAIGALTLKGLQPGRFRELTDLEVDQLKRQVGLDKGK